MSLLLRNLLFTVVVPGTVGVWLPLAWVRRAGGGVGGPAGWSVALSLPVLVAGAGVYAWCVWDFASFGRGTPLPLDAPRRLVVRGLYRYTRNPMYLGVLCLIAGQALCFRSGGLAAYGLLVWACFHAMVRLYEEPHLARTFGAPYDAYRARVPRWLPRRRAGRVC